MTVLSIGNFDGVHQGHRAILHEAKQLARSLGARVIAMPFDPHPAHLLRPGSEPPRLISFGDKVRLLREAGADDVVPITPTAEFLEQSPDAFVAGLVSAHKPRAIVEGADFHFGKDRAGNIDTLTALGERHGFRVVTLDRVDVSLHDQLVTPVSSSLIRWLLSHGRVEDAARCLGRPFALTATVVEGDRRGRSIGVPTANLSLDDVAGFVIPGPGVYAGRATVDGDARLAAISVGIKPTFKQRELVIEAHLLDFAGDIYGRSITLEFHRWLRAQQPFPGIDALRDQLQRDIARTRQLAHADLLTWDDAWQPGRPATEGAA